MPTVPLRRFLAMVAADQLAMVVGGFMAEHLYHGTLPPHFYPGLMCSLAPGMLSIFLATGVYGVLDRIDLRRWCFRALSGAALAVCIFLTIAYALKASIFLPRLMVGPWIILASSGMCTARLSLWVLERRRLRNSAHRERTILVGNARVCLRLAGAIDRNRESGLEVCALVADGITSGAGRDSLAIYPLASLAVAVAGHQAQRVVVCGRIDDHDLVNDVLRQMREIAVTVQYAPTCRPSSCSA